MTNANTEGPSAEGCRESLAVSAKINKFEPCEMHAHARAAHLFKMYAYARGTGGTVCVKI
jgi:hypothetical protein